MITTLVGTGVAYGWLYLKATHVQNYLEQRALVQQAREISDFIVVGENGSVTLNLPPRLSEAYNSVKSSYRYAVRDEAGRIVAASGRGVGPLPLLHGSQRRSYEQNNGDTHIIGAAIETTFDQRTFTTQVEQIAPRLQSINAAVFNEFVADGGWLIIVFLLGQLGISVFTVRRGLHAARGALGPGRQDQSGQLEHSPAAVGRAAGDPAAGRRRQQRARSPRRRHAAAARVHRQCGAPAAHAADGARRQYRHDGRHGHRRQAALRRRPDEPDRDPAAAGGAAGEPEHLHRRSGGLNAMVREAAENLGPLAISTQKTLEVDEPTTPVFVRGNTHAVVAAVSNLIENALNHSPPGGAVKIRVTPMPSIEVLDSGPGVPLYAGKDLRAVLAGRRAARKAPAWDWRSCDASCGRCGARFRFRCAGRRSKIFPGFPGFQRASPIHHLIGQRFPALSQSESGAAPAGRTAPGCRTPRGWVPCSCLFAVCALVAGRLIVSFPSAGSL